MKQKRVLIVGASGFAGKKLLSVGKSHTGLELSGTAFTGAAHGLITLDVRDPKMVEAVLHRVRPDVIVYAAGVANVDRAEKERGLTDDLNANVLRSIAHVFQGHFIYLSTHYVFDGTNPPYAVDAERNPVNYYGQSKVRGEDLTKELFPAYAIVRLDTLYGYNDARDRETFITEVIHALSVERPLYLDNEMGRSPILIDEAADYIFDLAENGRRGVFQLATETSITKYAWARSVAQEFGYDSALIHSLQEYPEKVQPMAKRAWDPRMVSSRKMSGAEEGLKKMHKQMIAEVERRFEDDMEYFDTDSAYLGTKSRSDIHRNGNWHMAVQTFIVRRGIRGQLQVLSQHRRVVDIAKRKWDHSAAVQMLPEDKRDPLRGIRRGLDMELGIGGESIEQLLLASDGIAMRSSRKYGDEPDDLYNREFVFVTVAELKSGAELRPDPIKMDRIRWVDWNELVPAVLADAAHYTKNLRHNFVNTALAAHIRRIAERALGIKDKSPAPEDRLVGSAYYSPPNNEDLALSVFASGKAAIEHLTASGLIERKEVENEDGGTVNELLKQPNLLPRYVHDKGMFAIDSAMIPPA